MTARTSLRLHRLSRCFVALSLLVPFARAQTIHSALDESELLAALAAAIPGDVIELEPGNFKLSAPLVIDKGVTIQPAGGSDVSFDSVDTIRVQGVPVGQVVVLRSLSRPKTPSAEGGYHYADGLEILDCDGVVVIEGGSYAGAARDPNDGVTPMVGAGLYVEDTPNVLLKRTTLTGRSGFALGSGQFGPVFEKSAPGLHAVRSGIWVVPLVDGSGTPDLVTCQGGNGYALDQGNGDPGSGCVLEDSSLHGCAEFRGGASSSLSYSSVGCVVGTDGAHGIEGLGASQATLHGHTVLVPTIGATSCPFTDDGVDLFGFTEPGAVVVQGDELYGLDFQPSVLQTGQGGAFVVQGTPGSAVWLAVSLELLPPSGAFTWFDAWLGQGIVCFPQPVTLPGSGIAAHPVVGPTLSGGGPFVTTWTQGFSIDPVGPALQTLPPTRVMLRP